MNELANWLYEILNERIQELTLAFSFMEEGYNHMLSNTPLALYPIIMIYNNFRSEFSRFIPLKIFTNVQT